MAIFRPRVPSSSLGPLFAAITSLAVAASACANGTIRTEDSSGGAGSSSTGVLIAGAGGAGGALSFTLPFSSAGGAPANGSSSPGDEATVPCTDGANCVCPTLSVAVVGKPGIWGDRSDTAFQSWLNSRSAGTAKADNYLEKPSFTSDFLTGYNLIILAGLGDDSNTGPWWTFSAAEVTAFEDWIENKGGGVISLAGYSSDDKEISAKNALLAFSGISYDQPNISAPCAIAKCHYECGNPAGQITDFNRTDPVIANLSLGVTMVGMDGGHPITAPADAHVAAKTTTSSGANNWLVAKVAGKGRVLVFADEWITYTTQWSGQSQNANDPSCTGLLPQQIYQTAQFWYNMIRWTQPTANCFTIVDNQQPVTIW